MKNNTGKFGLPQSVIALAVAAAISPLLFAQPAHAGYWKLTGTPTGGYAPGGYRTGLMIRIRHQLNVIYRLRHIKLQAITGSFTYTGTIQWVPKNGNLKTDPAPPTVTVTETSDVHGEGSYTLRPAQTSASDGLGDPAITTHTRLSGNLSNHREPKAPIPRSSQSRPAVASSSPATFRIPPAAPLTRPCFL